MSYFSGTRLFYVHKSYHSQTSAPILDAVCVLEREGFSPLSYPEVEIFGMELKFLKFAWVENCPYMLLCPSK